MEQKLVITWTKKSYQSLKSYINKVSGSPHLLIEPDSLETLPLEVLWSKVRLKCITNTVVYIILSYTSLPNYVLLSLNVFLHVGGTRKGIATKPIETRRKLPFLYIANQSFRSLQIKCYLLSLITTYLENIFVYNKRNFLFSKIKS